MINIAIDGTTFVGKTTLAKGLAKSFNLNYFDTDALVNALCNYYVEKHNIEDNHFENIETLPIEIIFDNNEQLTYIDDNLYSNILQVNIKDLSKKLLAIPAIKKKIVCVQRETAKKYDLVMEGRNIGNFVLFDAQVKLFLNADPEIRAERQYEQLKQNDSDVDYDDVLLEIMRLDMYDNGKLAPITKGEGAITIDTSYLSSEDVLSRCVKYVASKIKNEKNDYSLY